MKLLCVIIFDRLFSFWSNADEKQEKNVNAIVKSLGKLFTRH